MPLWLLYTLGAALCQNVRTTLQQKIRTVLSVDAANFVRYLYGAPLALGFLMLLTCDDARAVPHLSMTFIALTAVAGLAQIVATSLMIHCFALCNYALGTVYSKTETVFVALFATFIAGEALTSGAWVGIAVCVGGVALLATRGNPAALRTLLSGLTHKGALYGLLSGLGFAIAAGCIREASQQLPTGDYLVRGITVLACMNTIQVGTMAAWLLLRDRAQLLNVARHWRSSIWVGLFSVLGSAGWALAMTLQNAATVRAVGQIELVFTIIASRFVLAEALRRNEWIGCALVAGGVVLVLIAS